MLNGVRASAVAVDNTDSRRILVSGAEGLAWSDDTGANWHQTGIQAAALTDDMVTGEIYALTPYGRVMVAPRVGYSFTARGVAPMMPGFAFVASAGTLYATGGQGLFGFRSPHFLMRSFDQSIICNLEVDLGPVGGWAMFPDASAALEALAAAGLVEIEGDLVRSTNRTAILSPRGHGVRRLWPTLATCERSRYLSFLLMTTTTAETYRAYRGQPLFSMGFRPFFLFAAIWSGLAVPLWVAAFAGWLPVEHFSRDWHAHEMLFGYLSGVIAGFLLTAVPDYRTAPGDGAAPLVALVLLWCAGRVAMLIPAFAAAPLIDSAFLFVFAAVVGREIIAGRNTRNLPVLVLLTALGSANVLTHLRSIDPDLALLGERIGVAVVATLVALIGGRIVPSFTRNWMAKRQLKPEPASPSRFDSHAGGWRGESPHCGRSHQIFMPRDLRSRSPARSTLRGSYAGRAGAHQMSLWCSSYTWDISGWRWDCSKGAATRPSCQRRQVCTPSPRLWRDDPCSDDTCKPWLHRAAPHRDAAHQRHLRPWGPRRIRPRGGALLAGAVFALLAVSAVLWCGAFAWFSIVYAPLLCGRASEDVTTSRFT